MAGRDSLLPAVHVGSDFNVIPQPEFEELAGPTTSCIHDGVPHFAWVDFGLDAGTGFYSGPFVGRWNGTELEPVGMDPWPGTTSPFEDSTQGFSWGGLGPFIISGPRLASDGTNLYLAYKAAMLTGAGYGFWVRVWKWDGATWERIGVIETAITNWSGDLGISGDLALSASPASVDSCYLLYYEKGLDGSETGSLEFANFWVCGFGEDEFVVSPGDGL